VRISNAQRMRSPRVTDCSRPTGDPRCLHSTCGAPVHAVRVHHPQPHLPSPIEPVQLPKEHAVGRQGGGGGLDCAVFQGKGQGMSDIGRRDATKYGTNACIPGADRSHTQTHTRKRQQAHSFPRATHQGPGTDIEDPPPTWTPRCLSPDGPHTTHTTHTTHPNHRVTPPASKHAAHGPCRA
jgi:hypothetical protein